MNSLRICIALGALPLITIASAARAEPVGRWWSGWAMGTSEYGFNDGAGNKVLISCSDDTGTSIAVYFGGKSPRPGDRVVFSVDGDKVDFVIDRLGQVATTSRVDSSNFQYLWGKMRKGGRLQVSAGGRSASYPLAGSARVLEAQACTTDFDR